MPLCVFVIHHFRPLKDKDLKQPCVRLHGMWGCMEEEVLSLLEAGQSFLQQEQKVGLQPKQI